MSGLQRRVRPEPEHRYVLVPYDKQEAMSVAAAAERSASQLPPCAIGVSRMRLAGASATVIGK